MTPMYAIELSPVLIAIPILIVASVPFRGMTFERWLWQQFRGALEPKRFRHTTADPRQARAVAVRAQTARVEHVPRAVGAALDQEAAAGERLRPLCGGSRGRGHIHGNVGHALASPLRLILLVYTCIR